MSNLDVQRKRADSASTELSIEDAAPSADRTRFSTDGSIPPVQMMAGTAQLTASQRAFGEEQRTHQIAERGASGSGQELPHLERIAQSFGPSHAETMRGIQAHVGGPAAEATSRLGAQAYAYGDAVAFGAQPDLHTAAHEAAHVVQQRAGVHLKGNVGEHGDPYENHANAVADRVVQGKPADDLLAPFAGQEGGGGKRVQTKAVQFLGHELGTALPEGTERPMYGEDPDQRRYSRPQYEQMLAADRGRELDPIEQETIRRGCIGITANNISKEPVNPLEHAEACFGTFEQAHAYMEEKNKHRSPSQPQGSRYILFAKLFWSNQTGINSSQPDDKAFRPDPETGRVDMKPYQYREQPGYVNFDYGFWDETSQCFWHANHMELDGAMQKTNPMKVYQSSRERFTRGYIDFDRIVFCVALATNYDPGKAALDAAARRGG